MAIQLFQSSKMDGEGELKIKVKRESHMPTTMTNNRVKYNSQPW
jgi:hypothetical protein